MKPESTDTALPIRASSVTSRKLTTVKATAYAVLLVNFCLVGCSHIAQSGGTSGFSAPFTVVVSPASVTLAAGSTTAFAAVFTPTPTTAGSLTWSVNPANAGTITSAGLYTAGGTTGSYTITATWTPSSPSAGTIVSGSTEVTVLPPPQQETQLNLDLTIASGINQSSGTIQNTGIAGQNVPWVVWSALDNSVQIKTGFTIPVPCASTATSCP